MYISPVFNFNHRANNNIHNRISFQSVPTYKTSQVAGSFSRNTSKKLYDVLSAYKDIRKRIASLTQEGLEYLKNNYPNLELGEGLTFHNCGENNTSILIRCAESIYNQGLSRIIEKKGSSEWDRRFVLNSFLLENHTKALVNNDPNKQKNYPKEREYLTNKEMIEQNYEESLNKILENLDFGMLKLRLFLNKVEEKYKTIPEGILSDSTQRLIRTVEDLEYQIERELSRLPKKIRYSARKEYPNIRLVSGLSYTGFQNLGKEKISIVYTDTSIKGAENWRRLNIYDENNNPIKSFVITDKAQMVSNMPKHDRTHMPKKITFANAQELSNPELEPEFEKYLQMYKNELENLLNHIKVYAAKRLEKMQETPLEFSSEVQNNMNFIQKTTESIKKHLLRVGSAKACTIKKEIPGLCSTSGKRGISFSGFEDGKTVQLARVGSKFHENLTRLVITDKNGEEKTYLIKDNKYVVKNYNAKFLAPIPRVLKFWSEADDEFDPVIASALEFLKEKVANYNSVFENSGNVPSKDADRTRRIIPNTARMVPRPLPPITQERPTITSEEISKRKKLIDSINHLMAKASSHVESAQTNFEKEVIEKLLKLLNKYNKD